MTMSKTLHLHLKSKWYELIESGEKREEYRELKPYWRKRLCDTEFIVNDGSAPCGTCPFGKCNDFAQVQFYYGYTTRSMTFEIECISIGVGNPEWGAPSNNVFILKLGRRLS